MVQFFHRPSRNWYILLHQQQWVVYLLLFHLPKKYEASVLLYLITLSLISKSHTFSMYVCMYEICFYSCLLSYYMLINVDYTITYFLPIPSTVPRTRARSELLNVSLVPPRVEFYTALPVSIVGRY